MDDQIGTPVRVEEAGAAAGGQMGGGPPPQNQFQNHNPQQPPQQPWQPPPPQQNGFQQPPPQQQPQQQQYQPPPQQQWQPPPPQQQQQQYQPPPQQQGFSPQQPYQQQQQYQPPPQQQWQPPPQQQQQWQPPPPQQQQQYQPPQQMPSYNQGGPVSRDGGGTLYPLTAINPYTNGRWLVRVRVMSKDKRTYRNAKGEGKLFNVTVADNTGEIRMTGFNEQLDAFYDRLTIGRVYLIGGGVIKQANQQYNTTGHNCEITLGRQTSVEESDEPQGENAIPRHNYKFTSIASIEQAPDDNKVDVLAILVTAGDVVTFTNKKGGETTKRVLTFADTSGVTIEGTVFGDKARENWPVDCTVAVKGAKVGAWNQKSLTLNDLELHPDLPEAHDLQGWWQSQGKQQQATFKALSVSGAGGGGAGKNSQRIYYREIEEKALGLNGGQPDYFSVRCRVSHIKTDGKTLWYIACPECKKKVQGTDEHNLEGSCEKCGKQVQGSRRWIIQAKCVDATGGQMVSFFDDTGVQMIGKTADELAPLRDPEDSSAFDRHFSTKQFECYIMRCRIASESYNDESRLKTSCLRLEPCDWVTEGRTLLDDIASMR